MRLRGMPSSLLSARIAVTVSLVVGRHSERLCSETIREAVPARRSSSPLCLFPLGRAYVSRSGLRR